MVDVSSEPADLTGRPQDRHELTWEPSYGFVPGKKPLMHRFMFGIGPSLVWLAMVFGLGFYLQGQGVSGRQYGVIVLIVFVGGGAVLEGAYNRWKEALPSPVLSLPIVVRQGDVLRVDVRFDASLIESVEVVAIERHSSKNSKGRSRTSYSRLASQLLTAQSDSVDGVQEFVGQVPTDIKVVDARWFVAIDVRYSERFSYVRPYRLEVLA